ncbi:hypothetical protein ABC383_22690 [Noviherbaspirillum sp. 1P10PC]|uniref:hypothetical protein n=1 Tax=Noviherbaspirillum sp. 1P10PC TaxID=3132292 RepID=UPI0039A05441
MPLPRGQDHADSTSGVNPPPLKLAETAASTQDIVIKIRRGSAAAKESLLLTKAWYFHAEYWIKFKHSLVTMLSSKSLFDN